MSNYLSPGVIEHMQITEEDIFFAEQLAEGEFGKVDDPPPQFLEYVKLLAVQRACIRLAQTEDTIFLQKAKSYNELIEKVKSSLSNVLSRRGEKTGTVRFYRC